MKTHKLDQKDKYPKFHKWVSSPKDAPKINVYSTEAINTGDKIELKGETFTVTKVSSSKPNEEYAVGKTMFYEMEVSNG